jgi:isoleucyl-tRNA synthetase
VVEEMNDFDEWCISEEGVWGIPIPFFERVDRTGEVFTSPEIVRYIADIFKEEGSDAWYSKSVEELLPPRFKNEAQNLRKGNQIFDIWF